MSGMSPALARLITLVVAGGTVLVTLVLLVVVAVGGGLSENVEPADSSSASGGAAALAIGLPACILLSGTAWSLGAARLTPVLIAVPLALVATFALLSVL